MKIEIRRRWKKEGYTIGELYVNGEYRCNTLEPQDRGFKSSMSSMSISLVHRRWILMELRIVRSSRRC